MGILTCAWWTATDSMTLAVVAVGVTSWVILLKIFVQEPPPLQPFVSHTELANELGRRGWVPIGSSRWWRKGEELGYVARRSNGYVFVTKE